MKKAIIIYWSNTGNTEKVALAIKQGLETERIKVSIAKTTEATDIDYFDYDLVCLGTPSIQWHPPPQVTDFLLKKFEKYKEEKKIRVGSPKIAGKYALIFCTYSGPHTGIKEAKLLVCMLVSSLNILDLQFWMSGIYLGNFMVQIIEVRKAKWVILEENQQKKNLEK